MALAALAVAGSSPLARGLLPLRRGRCPSVRIIPARAGFTASAVVGDAPVEDHPRSRGVYRNDFDVELPQVGSSPLARGLPHFKEVVPRASGIIPARAGFTVRWFLFLRTRRDHPRSRGVYRIGMVLLIQMCGSSPLARGLPGLTTTLTSRIRIIPARAGFTLEKL